MKSIERSVALKVTSAIGANYDYAVVFLRKIDTSREPIYIGLGDGSSSAGVYLIIVKRGNTGVRLDA